jgi:hypothetical protein
LVDFYEIQREDHAIEGDLQAKVPNSVAAIILKMEDVQIFEVVAKFAPVNVGPWNFVL